MSWWQILVLLRDRLAALSGVQTCRIGLEPDITPDDYPIVRLVPQMMRAADGQARTRSMDLLVYFGSPVHGFEADDPDTQPTLGGTEEVYEALFALEQSIITALKLGEGFGIRHVDTVTDEDRIAAYKLMVCRFEVIGRNPI